MWGHTRGARRTRNACPVSEGASSLKNAAEAMSSIVEPVERTIKLLPPAMSTLVLERAKANVHREPYLLLDEAFAHIQQCDRSRSTGKLEVTRCFVSVLSLFAAAAITAVTNSSVAAPVPIPMPGDWTPALNRIAFVDGMLVKWQDREGSGEVFSALAVAISNECAHLRQVRGQSAPKAQAKRRLCVG